MKGKAGWLSVITTLAGSMHSNSRMMPIRVSAASFVLYWRMRVRMDLAMRRLLKRSANSSLGLGKSTFLSKNTRSEYALNLSWSNALFTAHCLL